nr:hypothetical protein [uncultured Helicobacter sp.]
MLCTAIDFMVAKHDFATLAIVESALDSALAESIKSMLHALRVILTLAPLVVRSFFRKSGRFILFFGVKG